MSTTPTSSPPTSPRLVVIAAQNSMAPFPYSELAQQYKHDNEDGNVPVISSVEDLVYRDDLTHDGYIPFEESFDDYILHPAHYSDPSVLACGCAPYFLPSIDGLKWGTGGIEDPAQASTMASSHEDVAAQSGENEEVTFEHSPAKRAGLWPRQSNLLPMAPDTDGACNTPGKKRKRSMSTETVVAPVSQTAGKVFKQKASKHTNATTPAPSTGTLPGAVPNRRVQKKRGPTPGDASYSIKTWTLGGLRGQPLPADLQVVVNDINSGIANRTLSTNSKGEPHRNHFRYPKNRGFEKHFAPQYGGISPASPLLAWYGDPAVLAPALWNYLHRD